MTHPPQKKSYPVPILSACCPEAQADGVPCVSLGRNCDECQRAVDRNLAAPEADPEDRSDFWGV